MYDNNYFCILTEGQVRLKCPASIYTKSVPNTTSIHSLNNEEA